MAHVRVDVERAWADTFSAVFREILAGKLLERGAVHLSPAEIADAALLAATALGDPQ